MLIVSGYLRVEPSQRDEYLAGCQGLMATARATEGCRDFHLAADPLEADRINVYEEWDSAEAVEAFRGAGPSEEQQVAILDAGVRQHEVASTIDL